MATKKAATAITFKVSKTVAKSLDNMKAEGRKVKVVGRFKNGKLELDNDGLSDLAKKFPDANISFVAVNAPFKSAGVASA